MHEKSSELKKNLQEISGRKNFWKKILFVGKLARKSLKYRENVGCYKISRSEHCPTLSAIAENSKYRKRTN